MANNYVLAMYDVRAKQKFIYRSEHLKEIIGGSQIITDIYDDYLYPAAIQVRNRLLSQERQQSLWDREAIYNYQKDPAGTPFSYSTFEQRMQDDEFIGEVVYNGGGNFFILYKNAQICRDVTAEFTRQILEHIGTLKVICTYITDLHPEDYKGDERRLRERHRYTEGQEAPTAPYGTLPIVQADYLTSMPLTNDYETVHGEHPVIRTVTRESYAKYAKYDHIKASPDRKDLIPDEKVLDNLVSRKGEESLLAVIYIDGNNMGAKVAQHNKDKSDYDSCISGLREFSNEIQRTFIDERKAGIDEAARKYADKGRVLRLVVGSGDEITIITNARAALEVARSYLRALPQEWSSCAGISVFHSHTPFADAYRIAEECCESGKRYMKERQAQDPEGWRNACMLDFHFNQGVIGVSLEDIRDAEGTTELSVPWIVDGAQAGPNDVTYDHADMAAADDVSRMQEILNAYGRSNTKGLLQAAREGNGPLYMELQRIRAHMDPESDRAGLIDGSRGFLYDGTTVRDKARNLMIRMIPVYDIWFDEGGEQ